MTDEARKKGIEIGAGLLIYLIAWSIVSYWTVSSMGETVLFLAAYAVLSLTTYLDQIRKIKKKQFLDENLLMILATAGAFAVGRHKEAVAAMLFYQVSKLVEELSLGRTKKSIAEFIDIRPEYANLKVGNKEKVVPPQQLELKQIIVLRPGEKIPVDSVVISGTGAVDMKALTGESEPRAVKIGDRLYSGCINLNGVLEARVTRLYNDSAAARIMRLVENANDKKSESVRFADKFTKYYTPIVILIALLTMILPPMIFDESKAEWIYRGLVILVAACPCGLMVSIPLAFLGGIGAASKQGILIKSGAFLEDLTEADTFVFDKTGTLTEGVFYVRDVVPWKMDKEQLLEIAALAESYSNHPIALSLREAYGKDVDKTRVSDIEEQPGYGVRATVDGKEVYVGNTRLMNRQGIFYQLAAEAGTVVYIAVNGQYGGYILISDVIRKDAGKLIRWMHKKDLATVMLTGDNEHAAEAVASKLHIESVYSELMPEDKVSLLEEFCENQMEGEKLVFVGDGINDAPVLTLADIGIAMGGLGADAALEAADIILMEDEPSGIIKAIRIAKATLRSVKQNMIFAVGMKIILIILAFFGFVTMQNAIIADMAVMLINILNSFWMMHYPERGV
ncbi:cadmium-translocating P-type ATPase [Mediterraneibacter catenae]|jgi:Cd2+/Zn2+-exporting ATPase|uniref:Cd(2+)-exporting ATPase n=1 Tax=Mediterraneibacter catenae TaxID=2594882 RepID=A0A5M9HWR3_9FIRM|nr:MULTISPECIES: heavy metal translocating P-type ATPase [Mediterraneibacter]KAA8501414.1 cadmium-translocating P-type ATPase [Mediterraneibacter catenae]MDN0059846.1 heavy metal translocating P-type ATPase [Mediterraneibacter glycyrrhizinilyticus]OUO31219.1 cadmium-translocating P-type ATPase [Lachnoclostridium sp. An298]